jgi:hypothetical protein
MQKVLAYAKNYYADCVPHTVPLFPELVDRTVNSRLVGWSQGVDATLRSNPTCVENKG